MNYLEQLIKIFNNLAQVATRGEDTVLMGQCLSAMRNILVEMQNEANIKSQQTDILE